MDNILCSSFVWKLFVTYFTDRPQIASFAQISPNILISGLKNGINLKVWPGLGNNNFRLHAKFQVAPTTCYPRFLNWRKITVQTYRRISIHAYVFLEPLNKMILNRWWHSKSKVLFVTKCVNFYYKVCELLLYFKLRQRLLQSVSAFCITKCVDFYYKVR